MERKEQENRLSQSTIVTLSGADSCYDAGHLTTTTKDSPNHQIYYEQYGVPHGKPGV